MSPAEEQLSLSEVCNLLNLENLETTYDDAIEAVRHRIKNAYSAVDKAVSDIGDELRSKLDPQIATAWLRKIRKQQSQERKYRSVKSIFKEHKRRK